MAVHSLEATPVNLKVLREAVLKLAGRGTKAERQAAASVTLDIDSAPSEGHGHPPITSIAQTGDMLNVRLRVGNVGTAEGDLLLDRFFLFTSLPWTKSSVSRCWRIIANAARPRATWAR